VLAVDHVARRFGEVEAVSDLSLEVRAGELYGLVGPDGAGKTTAIRMMTGLVRPQSGEARVLGMRVEAGSLEVREAIGYMPQQYSLYGDLSVGENLRFFGRLFGIPSRERAEREARLLALARLDQFRDRRADALSGGMYKKLALSCALLHRPQLLVLDEPTNGVDPVSRRDLWDLLYEFVAEGMAVLLATPYMDEAARCHRVGLVHDGRLLAEGEPAGLVSGFVHETLLVRAEDRYRAEKLLEGRPEVLALSPQGASLRLVVRRQQADDFRSWADAARPALRLEAVKPDFEDVFLGLLQDPESVGEERGVA
jgi:ABC-2 type transport system ATP-binding protein